MTTQSRSRRRLSTGHEVALPIDLAFAVGGVVVPARRRRLEAALPTELAPVPIGPGLGCVLLAGIQYHRVGGTAARRVADPERGDDADAVRTGIEPYDEFTVIVPTVRGGRSSVLAGLPGGEIGGYVHWLPVSTDAGVALGREIWGYPKERAEITVTDGPRGVRTVVRDDGSERVRLEVARPRIEPPRRAWPLWSYATLDGDLVRARGDVRGRIAIGSPAGASVSVDADLRRALGLWQRPLVRVYGTRLEQRLQPPEPIG